SIFGPRRKETESKSYLDTDRIVRKALEVDHSRMLKEERLHKWIARTDVSVAQGNKTTNESLTEVKEVFAAYYKAFLSIFNYYCLTSSQTGRGAFSIQVNQYSRMMQEAHLPDEKISVEDIGKIFVLVNFESDK
ncbi:unnamed protein product, partial [Choristocarpus tenellus]